MTIPEAASLVMQAGAIGDRGQVYVLDMGEPVKIDDLAKSMIQLSGRTLDQIRIIYVGSRAGEKLHEVLWNDGEEVGPTEHPKILRASRPPIDRTWLEDELAELERLVAEGDTLGVTAKLRTIVSEPRRAGTAGARRHVALTGRKRGGRGRPVRRSGGLPGRCERTTWRHRRRRWRDRQRLTEKFFTLVTEPARFCRTLQPSSAGPVDTVARWTSSTT